MPDQPDDPIHYEMKIPPEKKDKKPQPDHEQDSSDEVSREPSEAKEKTDSGGANQSSSRHPQ